MAYVYGFILTAVMAVLVEMLVPAGGKLGGHVRLVAGLCLLVALIGPIREGIGLLRSAADGSWEWGIPEEFPEIDTDYEGMLGDHLASLGQREMEAWVSTTLTERFGIPAERATVTATVTAGEGGVPVLRHIHIRLTGSSVFKNPHEVEAFFTEQLGCPCTVAVG